MQNYFLHAVTVLLLFLHSHFAAAEDNLNNQAENDYEIVAQRFCPSASNTTTPNDCIQEYISNLHKSTLDMYQKYSGKHQYNECSIYMEPISLEGVSLQRFLENSSRNYKDKYFDACSLRDSNRSLYTPSEYSKNCRSSWNRFLQKLNEYQIEIQRLKKVIAENAKKLKELGSKNADYEQQRAVVCIPRLDELQALFDRDLLDKYNNLVFQRQLMNGNAKISEIQDAIALQQANQKREYEQKIYQQKVDAERESAALERKRDLEEKERIRQIIELKYPSKMAVFKGFKQGNADFILVSTDEYHFYIKRILINDRVGNRYCDQGRVEYMQMGDERKFSTFGYCGNVVKVKVETNRGTQTFKFDAY